MRRKNLLRAALAAVGIGAILFASGPAGAHCDAMDGPVVTEAKQALEEGDVTPVLKWVTEDDEEEIRSVFDSAIAVSEYGGDARELATRHFLEVLVRLHRASEGAPYTGLKPAGTAISPAVEKSDAAIEAGSADELASAVGAAVEAAIKERYAAVAEARVTKDDSPGKGREFVHHYVEFVHFVKGVHEALTGFDAHGHDGH